MALSSEQISGRACALIPRQQFDVKERELNVHQDTLEKEKLKGTFLTDQIAGAREEIIELQKKLGEEHSKQREWSAAEKRMVSTIEALKYDLSLHLVIS